MAAQLSVRQKSMKWTDQRARLLQELFGAMRIIKYFCYEKPFLKRACTLMHFDAVLIPTHRY